MGRVDRSRQGQREEPDGQDSPYLWPDAARRALRPGGAYVPTLPSPGLFLAMGLAPLLGKRVGLLTVQSRRADLEQLAAWTQRGSLCGLGKTAPNPVLSTLAHFRDEYVAHLAGRCPAGRCRDLVTYSIGRACIGCTKCAQACASGAIVARPYERHLIDATVCRRCGVCRSVCPARAVEVL